MPTVLKAVSGDDRCLNRLFRPDFSGKVHSIFRHVINICDQDGVLYSLAAADRDNAPHTVLVVLPDGFRFDATGLAGGDPVSAGSGLLTVGAELAVEATGAVVWQGELPLFPARPGLDLLAANLAVLTESIAAAGTDGGLKAYVTGGGQGSPSLFSRELAVRAAGLVTALEADDFAAAFVRGRSLLGLGAGQTPSGDDFLAGLITVFHMPDGPFGEDYTTLAELLAGEADSLTTDVSRAMLQQAASGRARESVIGLLAALTAGESSRVGPAAARVLALGSASGTDIAAGLVCGLKHGLWLLGKKDCRHKS